MNCKSKIVWAIWSVIFSIPTWAADTCNGLNITGVVKDQKATVTIKTKTALIPVGADTTTANTVANATSLTLVSGSITKATIDSAKTCSVVASPNGTITSITVTGANLKDIWVDKATIEIGAVSVPNVNGVNGQATGIDVENASVTTRLDALKDPLLLSGSSEIVTMSDIGGKGKDAKIEGGVKLHYQDSEAGIYTLFTTDTPTDCYGLPDFISPCSKKNKYKNSTFGGITADELKNKVVVRRWTTGVLLVPYKFGIANHSIVSGSITLGPYVGYATDLFGTVSTFALSAGITNVPVPTQKSDGSISNVNKQGLSIATGFIFKPAGKDSPITAGFLVGVDQLGEGSQYKDNGKPWLGIYVGAGFGN